MKKENALFDIIKTPTSIQEAREIQNALSNQVHLENDFPSINLIGGLDVGYDLKTGQAKAALVTMNPENLKPIDSFIEFMPVTFPYVPGFLSFRETPVIVKILSQVKIMPDLLMIDGHGVAHPRRLGIAAHIGCLLDIPTIGVAKKRLYGTYEEPGNRKGETSTLYDKNEKIGMVLRSRDNVKPIFISPGHRVDFITALDIVQRCLTRYRLPEPTRVADKLSKIPKTENLLH